MKIAGKLIRIDITNPKIVARLNRVKREHARSLLDSKLTRCTI